MTFKIHDWDVPHTDFLPYRDENNMLINISNKYHSTVEAGG